MEAVVLGLVLVVNAALAGAILYALARRNEEGAVARRDEEGDRGRG